LTVVRFRETALAKTEGKAMEGQGAPDLSLLTEEKLEEDEVEDWIQSSKKQRQVTRKSSPNLSVNIE